MDCKGEGSALETARGFVCMLGKKRSAHLNSAKSKGLAREWKQTTPLIRTPWEQVLIKALNFTASHHTPRVLLEDNAFLLEFFVKLAPYSDSSDGLLVFSKHLPVI